MHLINDQESLVDRVPDLQPDKWRLDYSIVTSLQIEVRHSIKDGNQSII